MNGSLATSAVATHDDLPPLRDARVLVLGLGVSGRSAVRFCAERGARVVAADERPADALEGLDATAALAQLQLGGPLPDPADFDLVVPSPGIPRERYAKRAAHVLGDIELAARALRVPVVAVTGTNGKSTTTALIEALLRAAGLRARAAGNLGPPALELVGEPLDVAVLEVSSFQLEATERFRPRVAVVLNVTPDHLDRHRDFATYAAAKARLLAHQDPTDTAVLDLDDPVVRSFAEQTHGRVLGFSRHGPAAHGAWLDGEAVVVRDGAFEARIPLDGFAPPGRHQRQNAAMALLAAHALGADLAAASRALPAFRGLPHRGDVVAVRAGVRWIDDSKATNPGAAATALAGHAGRIVWIAGGRDKHLDFGPLADVARRNVKRALLIGEASEPIAQALGSRVPHEPCETLERAVRRAASLAAAGDVVLLAPACASFDQFRSYAERGDAFARAVRALPGAEATP